MSHYKNKKSTDITECKRKLKMFYGLPPYDGPTNFCRHDGWFKASIYNDFEEGIITQAEAEIRKGVLK